MEQSIYNKAVAILARRDHACRELERKLSAAFPEHTGLIPGVLDRLQEQSYLCDSRFSQSYIRYRAGMGFGPVRIANELLAKGVRQSVLASAMQEVERTDLNWESLARRVCFKKFKGPPSDLKEKSRQVRFLLYRGFLTEHFASFLNEC